MAMGSPIVGEFRVDNADDSIAAVDLQLARVETLNGKVEATQVQTLQVADGDVCRSFDVPMYMVCPRLYVCPTQVQSYFRVEFEVSLIITFASGSIARWSNPLVLFRDRG